MSRPDPTPASQPREGFPLAWLGLCLVLAGASSIVWWSGLSTQWAWKAAQWQVRPWQLWSASLAHLSMLHLIGNLLALAVLAVLGIHLQADHPWPV